MSAREDYEMERHADPLDSATDLALMSNNNQVETARLAVAPEKIMGENGKWVYQVKRKDGTYPIPNCVEPDCEDTLPVLRMEMGRIRCTACQAVKEQKLRGY